MCKEFPRKSARISSSLWWKSKRLQAEKKGKIYLEKFVENSTFISRSTETALREGFSVELQKNLLGVVQFL